MCLELCTKDIAGHPSSQSTCILPRVSTRPPQSELNQDLLPSSVVVDSATQPSSYTGFTSDFTPTRFGTFYPHPEAHVNTQRPLLAINVRQSIVMQVPASDVSVCPSSAFKDACPIPWPSTLAMLLLFLLPLPRPHPVTGLSSHTAAHRLDAIHTRDDCKRLQTAFVHKGCQRLNRGDHTNLERVVATMCMTPSKETLGQ